MSYPTEDATFFAAWEANRAGKIIDAVSGLAFAKETKITLAPTLGTIAISGAIIPVRGNLTVDTAVTVTAGFLYGAQGKFTLKGTINGSGANSGCGLMGQLDLSAAAAITAGNIAAAWLDCGATCAIAAPSTVSILQMDNTTTKLIHALILAAADAAYFMDITDLAFGGNHFFIASAPGAAQAKLKVRVNANDYYISLNAIA